MARSDVRTELDSEDAQGALDVQRAAESATAVRDRLALDRTLLANERTLLAYIRTALAVAGAGAALIHFLTTELALYLGWLLVGVSFLTTGIGIARFTLMARELKAGQDSGARVSAAGQRR